MSPPRPQISQRQGSRRPPTRHRPFRSPDVLGRHRSTSCAGADVAVDPVHHLFLVAQPNSSTSVGNSSIYVYDTSGTLVGSLHGFHFSNAGNVVAMHTALHPP
jgi:hypothetical protein